MSIEKTSYHMWAVRNGSAVVLSKDGRWIPEPDVQDRTREYYEKCRFASAEEAYEFLLAVERREHSGVEYEDQMLEETFHFITYPDICR